MIDISIEQDILSENLGPLHHGDVLSSRGGILRRNGELLAALVAWAKQYPRAAPALNHWYEVARAARWTNLAQTRQDFPHADQVRVASLRPVTLFNIAGNHYRLITAIHYDGRGWIQRL